MKHNVNNLTPEKILDRLMTNLSECNSLVSTLGKKTHLDREDLRRLRNDLMFARSKARNLAKNYENLKSTRPFL